MAETTVPPKVENCSVDFDPLVVDSIHTEKKQKQGEKKRNCF